MATPLTEADAGTGGFFASGAFDLVHMKQIVRSKLERGGSLFPILESCTTEISDEIIALPVQCAAVLIAVDALGVEHSAATSLFDVLPQSLLVIVLACNKCYK